MIHRPGRGGRSKSAGASLIVSTGGLMLMLALPPSVAAGSRTELLARLADTQAVSGAESITLQTAESEATFKVRDISGPAGKPIPVTIETTDDITGDSRQLFVFSGLPKGVTLNPGGDLGEFWAVNASVIGSLSLTAPDGFSGSFTVRITRSGGQPNSGAATMQVTIGGANGTRPTAAVSAQVPKSPPKPAPSSAGTQLPNHDMLMSRAKALFEKGDVAGARIIFEYLATQGSAPAAIAMGETFDPGILSQLVVKGLESDVAKARHWYEKAEELGSRDARRRLNAMMAR